MAATTICRARAMILADEDSARLYVSIMAFSSGLLLKLLLPHVPPTNSESLTPNPRPRTLESSLLLAHHSPLPFSGP